MAPRVKKVTNRNLAREEEPQFRFGSLDADSRYAHLSSKPAIPERGFDLFSPMFGEFIAPYIEQPGWGKVCDHPRSTAIPAIIHEFYAKLPEAVDEVIEVRSAKVTVTSESINRLLNAAKGFHQEALRSYKKALDVDPTHVPSLISTACTLRQLGDQSMPIVRSFLMDALRLDRTNPAAWYNLRLLYKADISTSTLEVAECFEAAALLEESATIEPFR